MKAFQIDQFGIDNLMLVEREVPTAGDEDVVVRFDAWSLNYRDLMVVEGSYNPRMRLPATPLSDAAGEIVAVGKNVSKWRVGQRVMPIFAQRWLDGEADLEKVRSALGGGPAWDGVLREFAVFDQQGVVEVPRYLSPEEAATLPCAAVTAWNALMVSGRLERGETVLTLGTGGVSVFAVQIAKAVGAKVIATSGSDEKLRKLKELGADEVINYRERPDWDAAVLDLTDKRGVDHVIEVGGAGTLERSVNAARIGGHIAMIGVLAGKGSFDPVRSFMKVQRLQGIFVGSRAMLADMLAFFGKHEIRPVIDREFPFDDARAALKYMRSGEHFGKIVLVR
ncbi:MAG: NAD(P)-dependent alcohol dehydrogenase [Chloracidobacterium sp.]|nr:NAD(P)-dependent alcohol dehydrogenase [Chloracidobacterium sp.]MCO5333322.1 NAD(P)-dependent alcohol dehydrogenase [Pyrinomonadaceae bacterium]